MEHPSIDSATPSAQHPGHPGLDNDTLKSLQSLKNVDDILAQRFTSIETVLVVMSARAMVYDIEALRQKIRFAYPDSCVYFRATSGSPIGDQIKQVDLLIDFTGPGQSAPWFYDRKLRRSSRHAVGRAATRFRLKNYDRVFNEKNTQLTLPRAAFDHERVVQREVLALAGVPFAPMGDLTPDRSKTIALELKPLRGK